MKKSVKIIIAALVAVLLIGGGIFAAVTMTKPSAEKRITNALSTMNAKESRLESLLGFDAIQKQFTEKGGSVNATLLLQGASDQDLAMLSGFGLQLGYDVDRVNKKGQFDISPVIANLPLLSFNAYYDDAKLAISAPTLFEGQISTTYDGLKTFLKNMDADMSEMVDSLFDQFLPFSEKASTTPDSFATKYMEQCKDSWEALAKATTVTEEKEKSDITVDGKNISCDTFLVKVEHTALLAWLEDTIDFVYGDGLTEVYSGMFGEAVTELLMAQSSVNLDLAEIKDALKTVLTADVTLTIALDSKDNLRRISMEPYSFTVDGSTAALSFDFTYTGATNSADLLNAVIKLEMDGQYVALNCNSVSTGDKDIIKHDLSLTLELSGSPILTLTSNNSLESQNGAYESNTLMSTAYGDELSIVAKGALTDIKKGSGFHADLDSFAINVSGEEMLALSGSFSIGELSEEITAPTGTDYVITEMDGTDFTALYQEILENLAPLMGGLDLGL